MLASQRGVNFIVLYIGDKALSDICDRVPFLYLR